MRKCHFLAIYEIIAVLLALTPQSYAEDCLNSADHTLADSLKPLIRAIGKQNLSHRGYISPDEYRNFDSKILAELLVSRLEKECDPIRESKSPGTKIWDHTEVMMLVPSEVMDSIAKYGFKNQHLTRSTKGITAFDSRFLGEQELAGLRLSYSDKGRELLPKSALLRFTDQQHGGDDFPFWYGDVIVVFKDEVKKRMTWTREDSLSSAMMASAGNYISFEHASGESYSTKSWFPGRTLGFHESSTPSFKCQGYCEAQIWGELGLDDVTYIMMKPGAKAGDLLAKTGIPIYTYSTPGGENSYPPQPAKLKRENLIYGGDTQKQERFFGKERAKTQANEPSPALRNIQESKRISALSDSQLIEQIKSTGNYDRLLSVSELALRNSPTSRRSLLALTKDGSKEIRAQAIFGLSQFDDEEAKTAILAGLSDPEPAVRAISMTIAADRRNDPSIRARLDMLATDENPNVREWYGRLFKLNRSCSE